MTAYGAARFNVLISRSNPSITQTILTDYFDSKKIVSFDEIGFKVAFAVEQYDDSRKGKDDPNFVAWTVQLTKNIGKTETVIPLKFHKCTDADYDSFYKPANSYKAMFEVARSRKNLYCIDDGQNVEIFGMGDQSDYQRLDFMLLPCKQQGKICSTSLQQKIEYLGSVDIVVLYNR